MHGAVKQSTTRHENEVICCRDNILVHRDDYTTSGWFEISKSEISHNVTVSASLGGSEQVQFPVVHFPDTNHTGMYRQL